VAVISDLSVFTRNSLNGVQRSLGEAVILTGLVLLVFLHSLRSTTIVLFAIPTSLISTFLAMNFLGFSMNIMTSMALVLVVGVLVDDSIVVLENVARRLELGDEPREAALKGRSEIGMAAIAMTLVDVVVFAPVAFMSGLSGQWFREFGLVIASAVLLSLFISFTLTPLLASRWLKREQGEPWFLPWRWFVRAFEAVFRRLERGYGGLLGWSLRHRWLPPLVAVLSLFGAFALVPLGLVKFEFIAQSDDGFFAIAAELPPGSSLEATEQALRQVEQRLGTIPEIEWYLTRSGVGGGNTAFEPPGASARFGQIQVVLLNRHHRQRSQFQIMDQVTEQTRAIPGATVRVLSASGGGGSAAPIQVRITGEDPQRLQALARRAEQALLAIPGTRDVTNSASLGNPETRLLPDRRRMADAGVTAQQAALGLRTAVEGIVPTKLRPEGQDEVDVRLLLDDATRASLGDIGKLPLASIREGQLAMIQLSQVTRPEQVAGPTSIDRRNRERLVTVGAYLQGTTPLNDVTGPLEVALKGIQAEGAVPAGYAMRLGGEAEDQAESFSSLGLALGLSVILEYMLLAALYESLILPFATMFALPVAIVGAFIALALTGNTLNLLSMIGMIVLMGLVGKNGILLIDLTNQLRQRGLSRTDALRRAGPTRFRPIVMTTMALVCGMFPLAAGLEEGSELYTAMATVIIGGMLSSTLLSLVVVPCMYTYFDDIQTLILAIWHWRPFRRALRPPAGPRPEPAPAEASPPRVLEEVGGRR
jgi:HAE1 family hydrophobic/amphiphilic exporter-1